MSRAHIFSIAAIILLRDTRVLLRDTIFSHKFMIPRFSRIMRESVYLLREFTKYFQKINPRKTVHTLVGFTTFAYSTLASRVNENIMTSFDTDSSFWVCDNSATGHICNDRSLFTGDLVPSIYIVGAATGTSEPTLMGTVHLRITDDDGKKHKFTLTHVNYMPTSPVNLLSTRVLSRQFTDKNGIDLHGTGIHSCYEDHTLIWDHGKYRKTFKTHDSGLPECLFSSGYSRLEVYSSLISSYYNDGINWAFSSKTKDKAILESKDGDGTLFIDGDTITLDIPATVQNMSTFLQGMKLRYNDGNGTRDVVRFLGVDFIDGMQLKCTIRLLDDSTKLVDPETLDFIDNPDVAIIPQTAEDYCRDAANLKPSDLEHILNPVALSPLQEEMLSYHYRLHHEPFPKLITLAQKGEIPKRLASLKGRCPICIPCLFGKAHKRPWRSKSKQSHPIRRKSDDHPGARASMDHLVSAQPGLIPQITGNLTGQRINGATVIVDHFSDHVYVYLMRNLTLDETILAKHAYERFLSSIGVTAKSYHADNGRFADQGFREECNRSNQVITFCGVGSHHQNGIAERKIKELTLGARTLLLHAKRMLPEYISTILWPFALKCAEDKLNHLVHRSDGRTPYETIAGIDSSSINLSNFHTFGSPCYVLDQRLQSGSSMIPKWEPRARMGIYVGRSPSHASNVALVLNPRTGHVSPQFHVVFDDDFTTVEYLRKMTVPPHWAELVRSSADVQLYTEGQKTTWQSLPNLDKEPGDFSHEQVQPNQTSEGGISQPLHDVQNNRVSFSDAQVRNEQEIISTSASNTNSHNSWQMPSAIDLDSSGLRRSSRTAVLKRRDKVYSHTTQVNQSSSLRSATKRCFKSALVLFSSICSVGYGLPSSICSVGYGLTSIAQYLQEKLP